MSSSIRSESNRDSVDEVSGAPSNVRFENQPSNPINPTSPTSESDVNTTGSGCGDYPEQRHAGAVGYGPNYVDRVVSIQDNHPPPETNLKLLRLGRNWERSCKGSRSRSREK